MFTFLLFTEQDLSLLITYTQCNKGFEHFTKSCEDFPKDAYQPYCAYNPNFAFAEPLKTVMTSRSITPGAATNSKGSSSGLGLAFLQDALTEVATDAAASATDISMTQISARRSQSSSNAKVSEPNPTGPIFCPS